MSKSQLQNNLNNQNLSGTTKLISKSFIKSGKYEARDILPESEHFGFNNSKEKIKEKAMFLKDLLKDCNDEVVKTWLRDKINEYIIEMY